jgi:hypothetical protein
MFDARSTVSLACPGEPPPYPLSMIEEAKGVVRCDSFAALNPPFL